MAALTWAIATNTTTNGKSTDWGKRNFSDYGINISELEKCVFMGVIYPLKF